jgi:acetyl-CoA carboxylase carboxyl transferase subunit beta
VIELKHHLKNHIDLSKIKQRGKVEIASEKFNQTELWTKCSSCNKIVSKKELAQNLNVCPICNFHDKFSISQRFDLIFDFGTQTIIEPIKNIEDPLSFSDLKPYKEKLEEAKLKSEFPEAIQFKSGKINDIEVIVGVMNFGFIGGSLGFFVGESIVNASKIAIAKKCPLIIFTASGGARMQEGIVSLMQMPRTIVAIRELKKHRLPYINVLCHPTTGGVSASFGMLANITLAEPKATIGLAGVRVIQQTLGEKIPDNFQTSEFQLAQGYIDKIVNRNEIKKNLYKIIKFFESTKKFWKE